MIIGQVNARREAVIPLQVRDLQGQTFDLQATIDTGFSGSLTLPLALLTALQMSYDRTEIYTLGDNNDVSFDLYSGTVVWNGQDRDVFVLATESAPLVGMSMLHGSHLFMDVVDGGEVRIERRP
jgi:clan AA aspartic protease